MAQRVKRLTEPVHQNSGDRYSQEGIDELKRNSRCAGQGKQRGQRRDLYATIPIRQGPGWQLGNCRSDQDEGYEQSNLGCREPDPFGVDSAQAVERTAQQTIIPMQPRPIIH